MTFLILDGNSLINRAFYGVRPLTTKDGRFTHAVHGFLQILNKLRSDVAPDALAVAFDVHAPTFRHQQFADYKAGRHAMPPELAEQFPRIQELLPLLGIRTLSLPGYEADDILGTLAHKAAAAGHTVFVATGDRDALQLVDENVTVLLASSKMGQAVTTAVTPEIFQADYGFAPAQLIEYKGLCGDSSDNIPGVAGIGDKTARALVTKFSTLENLYAAVDIDTPELKARPKMLLTAGRDAAFLSRALGTIACDIPLPDTDAAAYTIAAPDVAGITAFLADLEMFKMLERLKLGADVPAQAVQATPTKQAIPCRVETDFAALLTRLRGDKRAYCVLTEQGLLFALPEACVLAPGDAEAYPAFLKSLLEDEKVAKYSDDAKSLHRLALALGIQARAVAGDSALAAYVLRSGRSDYSTARVAQAYGVADVPVHVPDDMNDLPSIATLQDAAVLPTLFDALEAALAESGQDALYREMELPLAGVLAAMEHEGFALDAEGLRNFGESLQGRMEAAQRAVWDAAGEEFNILSPKQLGELLFGKLGLPHGKKTKTGYSTNAEVLENLAPDYPLVRSVLEYRQLCKLHATYVDGLLRAMDHGGWQGAATGRVHSTLNQTLTRTGRLSSSEPNLQNIPVRTPLGRELRRYLRAKDGYVLVDADYSQIELRILAHMSGDAALLEAFRSGEDIHAATAARVFGLPREMVTPLMRARAKAVNFGIVYGIGAFSLAQDISVSRPEAQAYIDRFYAAYPGVQAYMTQAIADAKANGSAKTLFGRTLALPELTASNFNTRSFGERVARNMPIQGTAADIIKRAMLRVSDRLARENMAARLILQVHDELILESPLEEQTLAERILKEEMEAAATLDVALLVDVHSGRTWYDAKG
ncbi:MAG: DNA polymerase I [Oscillospiraceae bacterium]|jgi:DNA polymerase-1|nr:DNA polymerase I [Oscillospiraceae bacterium]